MKIKFNNIRDLADARYAAAMMAEWIGFETGGEKDLSAAEIQEILGWCSGPTVVLEVKPGASHEKIAGLIELLPFAAIEAPASELELLKNRFGQHIKEWIAVGDGLNTKDLLHSNRLQSAERVICRIEPESTQVAEVEANQPFAISLDCFESVSTGIKDFDVWNQFFENLGLI